MTSPTQEARSRGQGPPSVTLSASGPTQPVVLHHARGGDEPRRREGGMFHKQNRSDELVQGISRGGGVGSPALSSRSTHLGVGHANSSSRSMDGLNSGSCTLSADHPAFARTRQYRSMSNDDMKSEMLPPKRMPGEPTNYMEAAAAALKSGKGSSIIDNLMKEYRSGNLYARQPADLLLPSAKEEPSCSQQKSELMLHRENSAPQLSGLRERRMKSPPDYPGHSRFAHTFDITPTGTPRAASPLSMMSDFDFSTSRSSRGMFGSRDSSVFSDLESSPGTRSRGRVPSPMSLSSMMSDLEKGTPPPSYPGFKRTPFQSLSGREYKSRKESSTVDHSRASSFGSYQHSMKRLSTQTSCDSSRGSSTSSTSPLSTEAPAPHPSPASQSSQATFELDHEAIASRATDMVKFLSEENSALRDELDTYYQKVAKLQKFEQEIHNVQTEHERLIESTNKREHLEKLVRAKLEVEVKKLQERNRDLSAHVETHFRGSSRQGKESGSSDKDLQAEISRKESIVFQYQMKCKDLEEANKQLLNELQEQRQHVDMLDTALSKAQADVAMLQEECAHRQVYVEKVSSMKQILTSLQVAHLKREKLETKFRQKLEQEIDKLRGREDSAANQDEGVSELEDVRGETLVGQLAEKESTILKLEAEVSKWEHKYLEECAIRQCRVDHPVSSRLDAMGDQEVQGERGQGSEGSDLIHKARIQDLEGRLSALSLEVQKRDMIIQALQNQYLERGNFPSMSTSSSTERLVNPVSMASSSQPSYQSLLLRRDSIDSSSTPGNLAESSPAVSSSSLQNLDAPRSPGSSTIEPGFISHHQASPASSTHSLHHQPQAKSPRSSTQNLYAAAPPVSASSSNPNLSLASRSPATSQQNLSHTHATLGSSHTPAGSQQSLGTTPLRPSSHGSVGSGLGSQERLMGFSDSYTSLSTSGLSMTGTDGGSEADMARERSFLDEKLKQLDLEIAQQDRILGSLVWKS
ncbi:uncharacterized protein [Diadema antillarum]|uniref:uncharacterized protein isoform X1 n=1 Tax=Diadema antillarum TaxID=105358 RepID=UPI003A8C7948